MRFLKYNSTQPDKKFLLAEESWKVFSQFLSRYQWAFDDPANSPRKTEIAHAILNRGKPGCCTFFRPEGYTCKLRLLHEWAFEKAIFNHRKIYYVSYGNQALLYLDIDLHYQWQKLSDGQEAKQKLNGLFTKFFGGSVLFWSPSSRGFNGYLKVDLLGMDYGIANKVFDRLEDALERFLAFCGNMADFEIKGKIGFLQDDSEYHWAPYGKLPIHHPDWNFAKLEQFKNTPVVTIHRVISLCKMIDGQMPDDVLVRHKEIKNQKGVCPVKANGYFLVTPAIEKAIVQKHGDVWWRVMYAEMYEDQGGNVWLAEKYYRPGQAPLTELEWRKEVKEKHHEDNPEDNLGPTRRREGIPTMVGTNRERSEAETFSAMAAMAGEQSFSDKGHNDKNDGVNSRPFPGKVPQRPCLGIAEVGTGDQPDAGGFLHTVGADPERTHKCQHFAAVRVDDLLTEPDSRKRQHQALLRLARYLKRVPTQEEAFAFIKDKNLYTGDWDDDARRNRRVPDILRFIALNFEPARCAKGSVNVGKYDAWAKKAFPQGMTGQKRGGLTEYMEQYPGSTVHVSSAFIAVFMSVVEFALLIDRNQDNSLPHRRGEELWNALNTVGLVSVKFDARKWAVCRDQLEKHGIIQIIDREYCSGQAMKWDVGTYFPFLGLWKTPKVRSLLGPSPLPIREKRRTEEHNTLLHLQSDSSPVWDSLKRSRPPPVVNNTS